MSQTHTCSLIYSWLSKTTYLCMAEVVGHSLSVIGVPHLAAIIATKYFC